MSLGKAISIESSLHINHTEDRKPINPSRTKNDKKPTTAFQKAKTAFTSISVEPIMLCYILPVVMCSIVTQNLSLEKSCRVNLNYSSELCDALQISNESYPGYKKAEKDVQTLVTSMTMYKNVILSLVPSLLLLFLGSWSDRHMRRKPCILIPIAGEIISIIGLLCCTYWFYELPIIFNTLIESVPPSLTGTSFALFMGIFSYVSGISSEKNRTIRIGAVNMFCNVSICLGITFSGFLFEAIGFYGAYSLALCMYATGLFYGIFFIKDQIKTEEEKEFEFNRRSMKNGFLDFFDYKYVIETVLVVFKSGENGRRTKVGAIMMLVVIIVGPIQGELNVMYFFGKYKFGWQAIDYSIFSTFQFVVIILGTIFSMVFLSKYLKFHDAIVGMISCLSKVMACFVYAFAPNTYWFYLGAVAEVFNGNSFIALKSIISKLVPPEELGKVNSFFGVCEAIIPVAFGPLYNFVYSQTMETMPGAFFLFGGILSIPGVLIFFWLYMKDKKEEKEIKCSITEKEKMMPKDVSKKGDKSAI